MNDTHTLGISCHLCKSNGIMTFYGIHTPFDVVSIRGDFHIQLYRPHNTIRCKCGEIHVIARNHNSYWYPLGLSNTRELSFIVNRLSSLHRFLENEITLLDDWEMAKALENKIDSHVSISEVEIIAADNLLAKYNF